MSEVNLEIANEKRSVFSRMATENGATTEVCEEFSLPDYVPEVRKVLLTRASVLPESKFISDGEKNATLEFGGSVNYTVIYVDDEGNLSSTPLSSTYEEKANISTSPSSVFVDTAIDSINLRATAPRKLNIKSRLKSKIYSCKKSEYQEEIRNKSSADELFIERKSKSVPSFDVKSAVLQDIAISEKLDTPPCESIRPIWCDAGITVKSSVPKKDYVEISGDVFVKCICECDGEINVLTKIMPIYEDVECNGVTEASLVSAQGKCVSLTISSEEKENSSLLFFDVKCEIECDAYDKTENKVTLDCYSTRCELDSSYKTIELFTPLSSFNRSFSINETVKRKSKDIREIIDTFSDVTVDKIEERNGKATVYGTLKVSVIGKSAPLDDASFEYLCETVDIPLRYDTDMAYKNDMICRASLDAPLLNTRIENDKLSVSGEAYVRMSAISRENDKILDFAVLKRDAELPKDNTSIRVYFPKFDDTLWDVAKKYHVKASDIMEKNSLDNDSLAGIPHLII